VLGDRHGEKREGGVWWAVGTGRTAESAGAFFTEGDLTVKPVGPRAAMSSGLPLMLAAAFFFTLGTLAIKLLGPRFRVWDIAFFRFSGGLVLLVLLFFRHTNPFQGSNRRLLLIRGCTGSCAFLCLVAALQLLPISTAMVIFYAFPAFAALFSYVLYREEVSPLGALCIAGVLAGIALLFDFRWDGAAQGKALAVCASALAGLTVAFIKKLRATNGSATIYLYLCAMGLVVVFPGFVSHPILPSSGLEWGLCAGLVAATLAGQLLMNQGFAYCRSWEGGVFMSSEVVLTVAAGILVFGDPVSFRFWIGSLLVLGGAVALNLERALPARTAPAARS